MIKAPDSFYRFAIFFQDEIAQDYLRDEEFIVVQARNGSSRDPQTNQVLKDFLTFLIEGPFSDDQLEDLWASTLSGSAFMGWALRESLPIMRDNIGLPVADAHQRDEIVLQDGRRFGRP